METIIVPNPAAVTDFLVKHLNGKPRDEPVGCVVLNRYVICFTQGDPPSGQIVNVTIGCIGAEKRLEEMRSQEKGLVYKETKEHGPIAQKVIFETDFGFELHVRVVFA